MVVEGFVIYTTYRTRIDMMTKYFIKLKSVRRKEKELCQFASSTRCRIFLVYPIFTAVSMKLISWVCFLSIESIFDRSCFQEVFHYEFDEEFFVEKIPFVRVKDQDDDNESMPIRLGYFEGSKLTNEYLV